METPVIYRTYLEYLLSYIDTQGALSAENFTSMQVIQGCSFAQQKELPSAISDSDLQIILQALQKLLSLQAFQVGLNLGFRLGNTDHGLVGLASLCSETVAESLQTYSDYFPIISPVFKLLCYEEEHYFVSESICEQSISAESYDFLMALGLANGGLIGLNIIDFDTSKHKQKTVMEIANQPKPNKALWKLFTPFATVSFGHSKTKLKIPVKVSQQKLASANAQTRTSVLKLCDAELEKIQIDFMSQLKKIIKEQLSQSLTAGKMALSFAMSERSFHRKLKNLGTSYGALCRDIKIQEAKKLLADRNLSIKEIAYALGYSEVTNFSSAFKKAEGVSPKQYQLRQGDE